MIALQSYWGDLSACQWTQKLDLFQKKILVGPINEECVYRHHPCRGILSTSLWQSSLVSSDYISIGMHYLAPCSQVPSGIGVHSYQKPAHGGELRMSPSPVPFPEQSAQVSASRSYTYPKTKSAECSCSITDERCNAPSSTLSSIILPSSSRNRISRWIITWTTRRHLDSAMEP